MAGKWISPPRAALLILSAAILPTVGVAAQRNDTPQSLAGDTIDEVVVSGKTIGQMRRDIERAEDRFFNAYNEINKDPSFEVNCRMEARTGSHLLSHLCNAAYYEQALVDESRAVLQGDSTTPAQLVYMMRLPEFRKNVVKLVAENPELSRLLFERIELQRRYEKELRARRTKSTP